MIELHSSSNTPNGQKVSIALEEMQLPYELVALDLAAGDQHRPEFLKINPNGRVPAIIDRDADNLAVFESGAILMYLADKTGQLMPTGTIRKWEAIQWLMFQMAGVGPIMGQLGVFLYQFDQQLPTVIERYQNESYRLLEVLDSRLRDNEYLAGEYSIADISNWAWAQYYQMGQLDIAQLPNLQRWIDDIASRPAVQRALKAA